MDVVVNFAKNAYDKVTQDPDPRTSAWPMIAPSAMFTELAIYLVIVTIGPSIMKKRKPYDMRTILFVYNIGLVIASFYMVVEIVLGCYNANYSFLCNLVNERSRRNPKELRVAKVLWAYYISKYIEHFDTVSIILRKKATQLTFLHVFHHTSIVLLMWVVMTTGPGGTIYFACLLNSGVHFVMYTYYALSAMPSYSWVVQGWKKYITAAQLTQFVTIIVHALCTWRVGCDYPTWKYMLLIFYILGMAILFSIFYIQSYFKTKESPTRVKTIKCN